MPQTDGELFHRVAQRIADLWDGCVDPVDMCDVFARAALDEALACEWIPEDGLNGSSQRNAW